MKTPRRTKRAAPDRATRDSEPRSRNDNAPGDGGQYAVYCEKFDGRRYLFKHYANRREAEGVARTLRNVGCAATVEADGGGDACQ